MLRTVTKFPPALAAAALLAVALAAAPVAVAREHRARAAAGCGVGSGTGYGYSYLTSLHVQGTTCAVGRTVARKHGHVSGWSCAKRILDRSPVQYDARVTCHSGSRAVTWTFTQNT